MSARILESNRNVAGGTSRRATSLPSAFSSTSAILRASERSSASLIKRLACERNSASRSLRSTRSAAMVMAGPLATIALYEINELFETVEHGLAKLVAPSDFESLAAGALGR